MSETVHAASGVAAVAPLLRVDAVSKQYATVRAVDSLSFDVRAGEIFALLGPNGAGKTSMVRMLVDILRPDAGDIQFHVEGQAYRRLPAAMLGYLPEERGLHRDVPVLKTLEYFGVLHGMTKAAARERALEGLAKMNLAGRERERIDALSKGNQQKVQFLCAVLQQPRFAVLDEPFSGLDPVNQQLFVDEIRALRDAGCTIVLSAHQMDLVESVADRLLVLDAGKAVLQGTLEEIRRTTHSGTRLQLGVDIPANDAVQKLQGLTAVASVEGLAADRIALLLQPDASMGTVLQEITSRVPVHAVHSGAESLREIFLRTVGRTTVETAEAGEEVAS